MTINLTEVWVEKKHGMYDVYIEGKWVLSRSHPDNIIDELSKLCEEDGTYLQIRWDTDETRRNTYEEETETK